MKRNDRSKQTARTRVACTLAGLIAVCTLFVAGAKAQCGSGPARPAGHSTGEGVSQKPALIWSNVAQPDLELDSKPTQASASDERSQASIVGLWRIKFTSGGTVIDEGWDQWHTDGIETLIDIPFGSLCPGVWERTGPLTFKLNHPAFNFNTAGTAAVSIFVYRGRVTLSPGGDSFTGVFTWDSYDFSGKFIPGTHLEGTLSARRVTVNSVPFF